MAWLSTLKPIFSALFDSVLSWIKDWYEQEKREQAEWAAKSKERQIESFKEAKKVEQEAKEAMTSVKPVTSADEWNKRAKERNK